MCFRHDNVELTCLINIHVDFQIQQVQRFAGPLELPGLDFAALLNQSFCAGCANKVPCALQHVCTHNTINYVFILCDFNLNVVGFNVDFLSQAVWEQAGSRLLPWAWAPVHEAKSCGRGRPGRLSSAMQDMQNDNNIHVNADSCSMQWRAGSVGMHAG